MSALIYLRALFESNLTYEQRDNQSAVRTIAQVMQEAQTLDTIMALQESAYLRSRFQYLLAAIAAAKSPSENEILHNANVGSLLEFIARHDQALGALLPGWTGAEICKKRLSSPMPAFSRSAALRDQRTASASFHEDGNRPAPLPDHLFYKRGLLVISFGMETRERNID